MITNLRLSNQLTQWYAASIVYSFGDENLNNKIYLVLLSNMFRTQCDYCVSYASLWMIPFAFIKALWVAWFPARFAAARLRHCVSAVWRRPHLLQIDARILCYMKLKMSIEILLLLDVGVLLLSIWISAVTSYDIWIYHKNFTSNFGNIG